MSQEVQRNTDDFVMTPIEKIYQEHLNQLSGMEKLVRADSLFKGMWNMIAHQVRLERGDLSDRDLCYYVAKHIHINDPKFLRFMEKCYNGD
jgi:hypothetical protein